MSERTMARARGHGNEHPLSLVGLLSPLSVPQPRKSAVSLLRALAPTPRGRGTCSGSSECGAPGLDLVLMLGAEGPRTYTLGLAVGSWVGLRSPVCQPLECEAQARTQTVFPVGLRHVLRLKGTCLFQESWMASPETDSGFVGSETSRVSPLTQTPEHRLSHIRYPGAPTLVSSVGHTWDSLGVEVPVSPDGRTVGHPGAFIHPQQWFLVPVSLIEGH